MRHRGPRTGVDRVAYVLAVAIGLFIVGLSVAVLWQTAAYDEPISDQAAQLVSATIGAVVGALSVYIGSATGQGPPPSAPPTEPPAVPLPVDDMPTMLERDTVAPYDDGPPQRTAVPSVDTD